MISFIKPINLNGEQLRQELKNAEVEISSDSLSVAIDSNEMLLLDIKQEDETKALSVVNAHNGIDTPKEPTVAYKLASVGLSIEELKSALGGN
jgi:hypothetical protein